MRRVPRGRRTSAAPRHGSHEAAADRDPQQGQQQAGGRGDSGEHDRDAQPRVPVRRACEQHGRPDGGPEHDRGEHDARLRRARGSASASQPPMPTRPPIAGASGDRVVGVDDPLGEAEQQARDDEPRTPDENLRAPPVGARGAARHPQEVPEEGQRGREQPRHLPAHLGREEPGDAGRAPHAGLPLLTAADHAARLVAGEPPEAVVAEHQLEHRVRLRAADVRPRGGRPQLDDRHPPARRRRSSPRRRRAAARSGAAAGWARRSGRRARSPARRGTPASSSRGRRTRRARRPAAASGSRRPRGRAPARRRPRRAAARAARPGCRTGTSAPRPA